MQFRTKIPLKKQNDNQIDYTSKLLLIGSCFSENIGNKLSYYQFQSVVNPLGILFHPKAIENLITNAINKKVYTEKDIFFHNERWHCFEAHSVVSNADKNKLLSNLNNGIQLIAQQLNNSTHIVITLGTSWVYRFIESDTIVANCHKIPQKKFLKEILSVDEVKENLEAIVTLIKSVHRDTKIIFTVSPVRHLKDGFIENQQSKTHLIAAIHQVLKGCNASYFPSYEIMMDELRDYRFYTEDMIHLNQTAIDYIWKKFTQVWVSEEAQSTMQAVENLQKGLSHKPFHKASEQHQRFLEKLQFQQQKLQNQFPFMNF